LFAIESGALEHERKPSASVAVLPGAVSVQGRF
jgi:hypothetical protein